MCELSVTFLWPWPKVTAVASISNNLFEKFRMCFVKVKHFLVISQEWLVRLMWNEKEMHRLDTGYNMWPWPLTSLMTLTLYVSRSNFETLYLRNCWSDWCEMKRKRINRILGWLYYFVLDLGVSRSESETASREWDGRLTWMWVIHSWPWYWLVWPWWGGRMYRIVTGVISDVSVPSTYLVLNMFNTMFMSWLHCKRRATKAPFDDFYVKDIFYCTKISVIFLESLSKFNGCHPSFDSTKPVKYKRDNQHVNQRPTMEW